MSYEIKQLEKQEKKIMTILDELHSVSKTALDKDFVRRNYQKYFIQLQQIQKQIANIQQMAMD